MIKTIHINTVTLPFLALLLIMTLTDPFEMPLQSIPLPFVLIGLIAYGVINRLAVGTGASSSRAKYTAALAAVFTTLSLLLKSLGQLGLKDLLILIILIAGLAFYINRVRARN